MEMLKEKGDSGEEIVLAGVDPSHSIVEHKSQKSSTEMSRLPLIDRTNLDNSLFSSSKPKSTLAQSLKSGEESIAQKLKLSGVKRLGPNLVKN